MGTHWNGNTFRFLPSDHNLRTHLTERYGRARIPGHDGDSSLVWMNALALAIGAVSLRITVAIIEDNILGHNVRGPGLAQGRPFNSDLPVSAHVAYA